MEEENKVINQPEQSSEQGRTKVGFPKAPEKKTGFNFKIFFILLIILLAIGGGAWYLFGRSNEQIVSNEPTPTVEEEVMHEETPIPTEEAVDRESIKIQILNGTGVSGAAGGLEDSLKKLGYSDFKTGNADEYSYETTEVTFGQSVPESVQKEIKKELDVIYETVKETSKSLTDYDVSIIVGFTKGYSPTPTTKPVSATPTPSSLTNTPTTTPTP